MMSRRLALALALALTVSACGSTTGGTDGGPGPGTDTGGSADTGGGADTSGGTDTGPVGPPVHDCAEADFEDLTAGTSDDRTIMVPAGTFVFDSPCITIRAAQAVRFMWDFSMHPLAGGVAPGHPGTSSEPNPIVAQTTGALYEPTFPTAGNYPFYCATHFHSGMMGVVRVVP